MKGTSSNRTLVLLLALALAAPVLAACTGDTGDMGAPGPAGATGPTGIGATGATGARGGTVLVATTAEPAGANCAGGGTKIEVGLDENENGILDASEIDASQTRYVCTGSTGLQTLVKTSLEPVGANCPFGGVKIEAGIDANANGVLDAAEVDAALTTYACNGQAGPSSASTGLVVAVKSVTTAAGSPIAVRFTLKDAKGFPVDRKGIYSLNTAMSLRFSISYITKDAAVPTPNVLPYNVLTTYNSTTALTTFRPTAYNPDPSTSTSSGGTKTPAVGTLVENGVGAGDYTYTFPTADVAQTNLSGTPNGVLYKAVAYDSTKLDLTHTIWIEATRQTNVTDTTDRTTFTAVNLEHNYIPSGTGTVGKREIVTQANCDKCHRGFKPEGVASGGFHGASRAQATYCDVCHNPARTSSPAADAMVFVHRLHFSHHLQPGNLFHSIQFGYPQDIRKCSTCHGGAAQGGQAFSRPSLKACGSCHDQVDFATTTLADCEHPPVMTAATADSGTSTAGTVSVLTDAAKTWTVDAFAGGQLTVTSGANNGRACMVASNTATTVTCHGEMPVLIGAGVTYQLSSRDDIPAPCQHQGGIKADGTCISCHDAAVNADYHQPVSRPDPNSVWNGGTNANTNAGSLANAGVVPAGADVITYAIDSVSLVDHSPADPAYKHPQMKFKLKRNGTDVVFQTYEAGVTTELMPGFVGSPSVYFVWAEPQDGLETPADYNVSAYTYVKYVWNGTTAGTTATLTTSPDANGFYTVVLTGTKVSSKATMLTGAVGYNYSLGSKQDPNFTKNSQPLTQVNLPAFPYNTTTMIGGLIVPPPNVWKVATGVTGRRTIVDNAKCLSCHGALGAAPTFHAGQRNDGPSCVFCHNPNRTSSGWSANSKDFLHAVHGGRKRFEEFTWHGTKPGPGYGEVEFPGPLHNCTGCHVPGAYDFSGSAMAAAAPYMLMSTVGAGRYKSSPTYNPTGWYTISPYVKGDNSDYGYGYATSKVNLTQPNGNAGNTQAGGTVTCTDAAPCVCTVANPCTFIATSGKQGSTTCTSGAPCTCVTQDPASTTTTTCSVPVAGKQTCDPTAPCEADPTTLVKSPVVSACSACHDSLSALSHMDANGGSFYEVRSVALTRVEQCLLCHGPGRVAAIADVHK